MKSEIMQIENARILPFGKNFSGNTFPVKNFLVEVSKEDADILQEKGVTVKCREPENPDFDVLYFVKVKLKFKERDNGTFYPKVFAIPDSMDFKKVIDPSTANELDSQDIVSADLAVSLYPYTTSAGVSGKSLWLHEGVFIYRESATFKRYRDIPEA